jgi:hypothetical protein
MGRTSQIKALEKQAEQEAKEGEETGEQAQKEQSLKDNPPPTVELPVRQ